MTAFLNPPIGELEIYMELPDSYKRDGFVTLLRKTLYGLKQSYDSGGVLAGIAC